MNEEFPNFDDFCSSFNNSNNSDTSSNSNVSDFSNMFSGIDMNTIKLHAERTGRYQLIVVGHELKGKIDVKWEIN